MRIIKDEELTSLVNKKMERKNKNKFLGFFIKESKKDREAVQNEIKQVTSLLEVLKERDWK